jgi:signal transduction histidine kinase
MLSEESTPSILIVDDEPSNLQLLRAHLTPAGYSIMATGSGLEALEMAELGPDLILLDILMPELDGLETCSLLKENEATRDIPVIFLSALQDSKTKVTGLSLGAVDFINKPFDGAELKIRVKTQICLRRQERQLSQYAKHLELMVEEQTRQLIHADRLATIGTLSAAIMHEISSPLTFVGGNIELFTAFWGVAKPILEKHFQGNGHGSQHLAWLSKSEGYLRGIQEGSQRIWQIMESLRAYTRRDNPAMEPCPLLHPIQESVKLLHHRLKKDIRVEIDVDPCIQVSCNPQKISQVFVNLINNAIDAMNEGPGKISIESIEKGETVEVRVRDDGPGVSAEAASSIFDPFYTTKPSDVGTGLGLFISRTILEEHEGGLALASPGSEGAEFIISLPSRPVVPEHVMEPSILRGEDLARHQPVSSHHLKMPDCLNTLATKGSIPPLHDCSLKP